MSHKKVNLLIDTATEYGVVALFEGETILYQESIPVGMNNSKFLLPEVKKALEHVGLAPKELGAIVVGNGPGSYTGIRVGVVVAKTLAYATGRPLVAISSMSGFVPLEEGTFVALFDAKISGSYALFGRRDKEGVVYTSIPAIRPLESLKEELELCAYIMTPNASRLKEKLNVKNALWLEGPPHIPQMVKVANEKIAAGEFSLDGEVDILYLRKTQAELEL